MDAEDEVAARVVGPQFSLFGGGGGGGGAPPGGSGGREGAVGGGGGAKTSQGQKAPSRRDSLTMFPEVVGSGGAGDLGRRLTALEESMARMESLLQEMSGYTRESREEEAGET